MVPLTRGQSKLNYVTLDLIRDTRKEIHVMSPPNPHLYKIDNCNMSKIFETDNLVLWSEISFYGGMPVQP